MTRRSLSAILAAALACMLSPALAAASSASKASGTFEIRGGGFGHGIGMSQYGAMGYALHGWSYPAILGHYYAGTGLGKVSNSQVTVLLGQGGATFKGASAANSHKLIPSRSYGVLVRAGRLELVSNGRSTGPFTPPLTVTGSHLSVVGKGRYAGSLEFYPSGSNGVMTVNAVDLEDYVRGVVAEEMPPSWPQQALDAQAIAARSYVLADLPVSSEYDVYADTRSQVYGGISAETPATNAAESVTSGQVVESAGTVIPTYFFSSSGGQTESIQNVWLGVSPAPYLVGVADPYDAVGENPYHRWSVKLSLGAAAGRLASLYRGTFEGVKVLSHGVSPRIVSAAVIGSRGRSTVSGATLQADLGTLSTWMSFTTVTAQGTSSSGSGSGLSAGSTSSSAGSSASSAGAAGSPSQSTTGGAGITALARLPRRPRQPRQPRRPRQLRRTVSGSIFPASRGAVVGVQLHSGGRWRSVGTARVSSSGAYALNVFTPGVYRAVYDGVPAPSVTLR
jgi:stage II sporulation protein D